MDKKLFALLLMVYVALLIGCSTGQNNIKVNDDYRSGTGALQLSFTSDTSSQVYEGESGVVVLKAKNAGAHSLTSGQLVLTTDDSVLYFGSKEEYSANAVQHNTQSLVKGASNIFYGKSAYSPTGDERIYTFPFSAQMLPQESQQRSAKIVAMACFPYETFQSDVICIDSDPYSVKTNAKVKPVCDIKDITLKSGGGPINVGLVQTRMIQNAQNEIQPTFYFTITASGDLFSGMKFFSPGFEQGFCDTRAQSSATEANKIFFKATLSDRDLVCTATPVVGLRGVYSINLLESTARVYCTTDGSIFLSSDTIGNYYAPLAVNISYGVVTTATQTIQVNALH